jgi:DNA repair protein RadC
LSTDLIINNVQNGWTLAFDIRDKKKEHLICLHLDSRNALIKKETLSIGLLDKSLIHPRGLIFINRLPCLKLIKYPHLKAICYIVKAFAMF